jgi:hypothetical protein
VLYHPEISHQGVTEQEQGEWKHRRRSFGDTVEAFQLLEFLLSVIAFPTTESPWLLGYRLIQPLAEGWEKCGKERKAGVKQGLNDDDIGQRACQQSPRSNLVLARIRFWC